MNQEITVEIHFFLVSLLWGGIILLTYDALRIIRRLIKHGTFFLAFEDLIFWITASVFIFSMMYGQNNGVIRGFSVMGMMIGMIIYHFMFSNFIVNIVVKAIKILLRPFSLVINILKKWIRFVVSRLKKAVKFLFRQLKKLTKSVKIAVYGKSRAIASKREAVQREILLKEKMNKVLPHLEGQFITSQLFDGNAVKDTAFYEEVFGMKVGHGYVMMAIVEDDAEHDRRREQE
jgi:spore cortex biosynthesis protein YabQ